ncbi:ATP-binding protein [Oceanobacillus bengalensis]|uniref:histidine kinase n=1 Tax=Oceanobacillus bengalensis TaxID=1435466 RepID=A0A494Z7T0_9BACI|nr:sensor histidine kinase [Oceanobacillus bengalensis]RKQ18653.1 sensor histidine kinase [Oceanobacillus bengalensis]
MAPKVKFNLRLKMIMLISLLIVGICITFALFLHHFISATIEDQIGKRALSLAESVANIPEIKDSFYLEDPSSVIQDIVIPIREDTGAEFIVVGNRDGIRYSHPDTNKIGKEMVGGDNEQALLHGQSYISKEVGTLGLSIRGKVPIYDEENIIGVVSVGFLNDNVQDIIINQSKSIWYTLGIIVLIGIIGAIIISNYIKKLLYDMEPEEISHLYLQKEAILESTLEGIIAIDNNGLITTINVAAKEFLPNQHVDMDKHYIGTKIQEILPAITNNRENFTDREMVFGEQIVLVNQLPMYQGEVISGAVITFRKKSELQKVTEELSRIKQYANAQRAQTHEHSNKLHIILGLILNNQLREAIDFIKKENNIQSDRLKFLSENISDPLIHALLLGKFNQALELGVTFSINPYSQLKFSFSEAQQDAILTALGNVIENALDAVKNNIDEERKISIFFTDIGEEVLFEIEDSGTGVKQKDIPHIFEQGFSTKPGLHHGTGLALSKQVIREVGGEIIIEEGELGGACFLISIPKEGDTNE